MLGRERSIKFFTTRPPERGEWSSVSFTRTLDIQISKYRNTSHNSYGLVQSEILSLTTHTHTFHFKFSLRKFQSPLNAAQKVKLCVSKAYDQSNLTSRSKWLMITIFQFVSPFATGELFLFHSKNSSCGWQDLEIFTNPSFLCLSVKCNRTPTINLTRCYGY